MDIQKIYKGPTHQEKKTKKTNTAHEGSITATDGGSRRDCMAKKYTIAEALEAMWASSDEEGVDSEPEGFDSSD